MGAHLPAREVCAELGACAVIHLPAHRGQAPSAQPTPARLAAQQPSTGLARRGGPLGSPP
jgi:hypothetical protein